MTESRPIPVVQVIDTLGRGGAERVLINIANELDPAQFVSYVLLTRDAGLLAGELAPHVQVLSLRRRSRWDVRSAFRFARLAAHYDFRIVHTHSHTSAYFVSIARRITRGKWMHVMHDHHGPIESSWSLRLTDWLLLRRVDYYFAVSARLNDYARRWLGIPDARRETLANGVPCAPTQAGCVEQTFTIVQVARLMPEKNQKLAIEVADALRASIPQFQWWLIGRTASNYAVECAQLVADRGLGTHVLLMGERADARPLMARAHVGVLTSDYEGMPIALLEYMAGGLPVVVTDVGECSALVRASDGGIVVPPGDISAFVDAIVRYAMDPAAAQRVGTRNRWFVETHYSTTAMLQRVSWVYDRLLGAGLATSAANA